MADEAASATVPEKPAAAAPDIRDEQILKFVGTSTLVVGIVLLIASAIAISVLSILGYVLWPWLPILPLSLLVIGVGAAMNAHYRKVIHRTLNPPKEPPPRVPYAAGFPYTYAAPPPMYAGPSPYTLPRAPPSPAPRTGTERFCIMCGRRVPMDTRFCPYCRHEYR